MSKISKALDALRGWVRAKPLLWIGSVLVGLFLLGVVSSPSEDDLRDEIAGLEQEVEEFHASPADIGRETEETLEQIAGLEDELTSLEEELAEAEAEASRAVADAEEAEDELASAEEELEQHE